MSQTTKKTNEDQRRRWYAEVPRAVRGRVPVRSGLKCTPHFTLFHARRAKTVSGAGDVEAGAPRPSCFRRFRSGLGASGVGIALRDVRGSTGSGQAGCLVPTRQQALRLPSVLKTTTRPSRCVPVNVLASHARDRDDRVRPKHAYVLLGDGEHVHGHAGAQVLTSPDDVLWGQPGDVAVQHVDADSSQKKERRCWTTIERAALHGTAASTTVDGTMFIYTSYVSDRTNAGDAEAVAPNQPDVAASTRAGARS